MVTKKVKIFGRKQTIEILPLKATITEDCLFTLPYWGNDRVWITCPSEEEYMKWAESIVDKATLSNSFSSWHQTTCRGESVSVHYNRVYVRCING